MSASAGIVVFIEHNSGQLPSHLETLSTAAGTIADALGLTVSGVVVGRETAAVAAAVAGATGWDVTGIENDALIPFNGERYKSVLAAHFARQPPEWVIMGHSPASQELAPGLAVRIGGTCVSGVMEMGVDKGRVVLRRPVFGGKLVATVVPEGRPVVVTLLPGPGGGASPTPARSGRIRVISAACPPVSATVIGRQEPENPDTAITEARTIVAAGNGVGSPEQMEMVAALARCFSRSAVAGSRPVCDRGWLPHSRQVGMTGTTVRPELYIACGISGAFQHVTGMREAGFVVAINQDPQAAIFQVADVAVVAELSGFLPVLLEALAGDRKEAVNHEVHEGEMSENDGE